MQRLKMPNGPAIGYSTSDTPLAEGTLPQIASRLAPRPSATSDDLARSSKRR